MSIQFVGDVQKGSAIVHSYILSYDFVVGLARWQPIDPHSLTQSLSESLLYA